MTGSPFLSVGLARFPETPHAALDSAAVSASTPVLHPPKHRARAAIGTFLCRLSSESFTMQDAVYSNANREFLVIQDQAVLFRSKVQSAADRFVIRSGRGEVFAAFATKNVTLQDSRRE